MRKLKKNNLSYKISKYLPVFIILLSLSIIIGSTFAYFTDRVERTSELTFSKVELSGETTTGINGVIYDALPGSPLVNGALKFSKSIDSEPIYVRAKLSYSLPAGANAGMTALLEALRDADDYTIEAELPNGAKWSEKEGNYFYLLDSTNNMFVVDTIDTYTLTSELVIPRDLEALDGNAQYMESINFHVAFEAIQADNISTDISEIKTIFREIYPESEAETIRYAVVINNQGEIQSQLYYPGEVIASFEEPVMDGFEFAGWFTKDGSESGDWGEEIVFPYVVSDNVLMVARFEEVISIQVNYYNEDFTSVYQTVRLVGDTKATSIDYDNVEVNETFIGWFTDTTFETMFDFGGEITSSVNVYPLVKQETSLNDFVFNNGQITKYKGSATEVVIPESYSVGSSTTQTISIASRSKFAQMYIYTSPDIEYPVTFIDSLNNSYVVNEEYELQEVYYIINSSSYPVKYENTTTSYIEGTDYNVTSIADGVFSGSSVESIYIPNSYTSIGGFQECTTLTKVYFSSNVTSILEYAFHGCTNLALTSLSASVESIGAYSFEGCTSLPSNDTVYYLPIQGTNKTIVTYAKSTAITSVDWPEGVKIIVGPAFANCSNLVLTSLPDTIETIGFNAFWYCKNITLTSLPAGLKAIDNQAFIGCTNLALTSLPAGVTSIGNSAFSGCTNLALTSLPASVTSIGTSAFNRCSNLALTSLPAGVTEISNSAFKECSKLALTSLPAGVIKIGDSAFYGCSKLALTSLPAGVKIIDNSAFYNCSKLALTSLPAGIETIGYDAFEGSITFQSNSSVYYLPIQGTSNIAVMKTKSTSVTSINWPDGVTMIAGGAFRNCTNLALTELPTGIKAIGNSAFSGCTNLALTELPAGITSIANSVFWECSKLALTSLPAGVTSIGTYAFYNCSKLALTSLPASLKTIGYNAFMNCINLALVSLPAGLISIDSDAFYGSANLNYILCESDEVAALMQGKGRDNTYIYSLQETGYDATGETEVVISDSVTIYTNTIDGVKWVRTSDNKYFKCIA